MLMILLHHLVDSLKMYAHKRCTIFIPQDAAVIWQATVNLRLTDRYIPVHTLLVLVADKARYANLDWAVA